MSTTMTIKAVIPLLLSFFNNQRYSDFLVKKATKPNDVHKRPYNWYVYYARYGNESEDSLDYKNNFDRFIITDNIGGHRV